MYKPKNTLEMRKQKIFLNGHSVRPIIIIPDDIHLEDPEKCTYWAGDQSYVAI